MQARTTRFQRNRGDGFQPSPLAFRRALNTVSRARTATIARILATYRAEHGRDPSVQELAGLLACTDRKAARYQALLGSAKS